MDQKGRNQWYDKTLVIMNQELATMQKELVEMRKQTASIEQRTDFLISKWLELEARPWWKKFLGL